MLTLILLLFALALAAPWIARRAPGISGWVLALAPACIFLYLTGGFGELTAGEPPVQSWPWVPGLGLTLAFRLDGLSLLFARMVTGIGALVLVYAGAYLKADLRLPRFYASILFFMGAMLGLVLADDLILLFLFWELTSVSSYLLIGYDHEREAARKAALQALLVTGAGGLALLAGLLLLGARAGTFRISELLAEGDAVRSGALYLPTLLLVLVGAFTKSAQFPFHFWLPGAMQAPTPVSAYLHSATMVKAGIYLLARLSPVLGWTPEWHYLVSLAGAATFVFGAAMALPQIDLKRILAYTTVSALGLLTLMLGLGTEESIRAGLVFLLVHALYKAALFMVAGTVDYEAGTRDITRLGGLGRLMPLTAAAAVVSACSMAGLPPLLGFIGKELVYEAKLEAPRVAWLISGSGILANALMVAAALVVVRPFFGRQGDPPKQPHEGSVALWLGPMILALATTLNGIFPDQVATPLVQAAASAVRGEHTEVKLALWHGINPVLLLSLATLAAGGVIYACRRPLLRAFGWLGVLARVGPSRLYEAALQGGLAFARILTGWLQGGSLRVYLIITVVTTVALAGWTLKTRWGLPSFGELTQLKVHVLAAGLLVLAGAAGVLAAKTRLVAIVALGVVGYGMALIFLFHGGPDLAMTQLAVETLAVVLFVYVLRGLPRLRKLGSRGEHLFDAVVALAGGAVMTGVVLAASAEDHPEKLRVWLSDASVPLAYGRNVVNVILVDFRSLDTLGEVTVLAAAALGVWALLKLRPSNEEQGQ